MKLLLVTTVLLFYMQSFRIANAQVTWTDIFKDCVSYEVSKTKEDFEESKWTCRQLGGEMASSDLTNSVFAAKAAEAVKSYRNGSVPRPKWIGEGEDFTGTPIWIGVYTDENVDSDTKFYFLNGQEMTDAKMSFKWGSLLFKPGQGVPPYRNPKKNKNFKCGELWRSMYDPSEDIYKYGCDDPKNRKNRECEEIWQSMKDSNDDIFNYGCDDRIPVLCMISDGSCVNEKFREMGAFCRDGLRYEECKEPFEVPFKYLRSFKFNA